MDAPIFLDHQAGSPLSEGVRAAMLPFLHGAENPASLHRGGVRAREALEKARAQIAALIGAQPEEIVFTSSGTEAANLALLGYARANRERGDHLLLGATEHRALLRAAEALVREGFETDLAPVDGTGFLSPAAFDAAVQPGTILAAVHWANHEVGTVEPVAALAARCAARGIALFADATAAAGWMPVDVGAAEVSLLSLSPRRFGGPPGAGALYVRRGEQIEPILHGGEQENGLRAGTENLPGIVGMGAAAEEARLGLAERTARLAALQERLWSGLRSALPDIELNGPEPGPGRSVQNLSVGLPGIDGEALVLLADMRGLQIASGAACVRRDRREFHVFEAMGFSAERARRNILFTLGTTTTEQEIDAAISIVTKTAEKLRS